MSDELAAFYRSDCAGGSAEGLHLKAQKAWPAATLHSSSSPCLRLAVLPWSGLFVHLLHTDMSKVFILDQSVCLFIKGFDHSTPWPLGSNYLLAAIIRFRQIQEYPLLYVSFFNCSSYSFSIFSFLSLSFSLSLALSHC